MITDLSFTSLLFVGISVVLPMIVALVTRQTTWGGRKAYVLLFLASVQSLGFQIHADLVNNVDFDWKVAVVGAVVAFVIAAGSHSGLLKPTGITGSEGKIQSNVSNGVV